MILNYEEICLDFHSQIIYSIWVLSEAFDCFRKHPFYIEIHEARSAAKCES